MTYVMGNICGRYDKYLELIRLIGLKSSDDLYLIGDMTDNSESSVELLRDISMRSNVFAILGDREYAALKQKGSHGLIECIERLDTDEGEALIEYLEELVLYEQVNIGGREYILIHREPDDRDTDRELFGLQKGLDDLPDMSRMTVISGHKPSGEKISRHDNRVYLNCGEGAETPLCALCLENGREYYV